MDHYLIGRQLRSHKISSKTIITSPRNTIASIVASTLFRLQLHLHFFDHHHIMNALRTTAATTSKMFMTRRFASGAYRPKTIDFTNMEKKIWNVKKDWLSDAGAYPIMVILGCAVTFMTGAGLHALTYKDVKINPVKRNSKLQTWGNEESHTVLERVISWNAYGKEGLGVDHEQWLKEKEASRSH